MAQQAAATAYTIYSVTHAPSIKRGADWQRYGVLQDRNDALQIARELSQSDEFSRVEVHATQHMPENETRHSRLIKTYHGPASTGMDRYWPYMILAVLVLPMVFLIM